MLSADAQKRLADFVAKTEFEEFLTTLERHSEMLLAKIATDFKDNSNRYLANGFSGFSKADDELVRRAALLQSSVQAIRDHITEGQWIKNVTL